MTSQGEFKAAWNTPPQGRAGADPRECVRLEVRFRAGPDSVTPRLHRVFRRLLAVFGDHQVEVTARVKNSAWAGSLPWKSFAYWTALRLPLSSLAEPSVWSQIAADAEDGWMPMVRAHRGGGAHRHFVWSLDEHSRKGDAVRCVSLDVATRHIGDGHQRSAARAGLAYFRLFAKHAEVVNGWGELRHLDNVAFPLDDNEPEPRLALSQFQLEQSYRNAVPLISDMHRLMLLSPRHVRALGGEKSLRRRSHQAEVRQRPHDLRPGRCPYTWGRCLRSFGRSVLWIEESTHMALNGYRHAADPSHMLWMRDELIRAGLFDPAISGGFDRYVAYMERAWEKYAREQQEAASRNRVKRKAQPPRLATPRCIRYPAQRAKQPPPGFELLGHHRAFELPVRDLAQGVTIYGRRSSEPPRLNSPVLVASTNPARATMFFDSRIHGWDGEHAPAVPAKARPIGRLTQLVCPKCDSRYFKAWANFEYPDDLAEDLAPDQLSHAQDYFTWFWLIAQCAGCKWNATVADVECG